MAQTRLFLWPSELFQLAWLPVPETTSCRSSPILPTDWSPSVTQTANSLRTWRFLMTLSAPARRGIGRWWGPPWRLTCDHWEDTQWSCTYCLHESRWAEACSEAHPPEWWNTERRWSTPWTSSGSLYTRGGLRGNLAQWWPQWWPQGPQLATRGAMMRHVEKEMLLNCTSSLLSLLSGFLVCN